MATLPEERRLQILDQVRSRTLVRTDELAARFSVSAETIRRDLVELEREGLTRRVYGGVTSPSGRSYEAPFEQRRLAYAEQKRAMGRLAWSLVKPDDLVILDVGTSVAAVAAEIPSTFSGRVLTNSLLAAHALTSRQGIEILISGGRLRPGDLACFGATAEAFFGGFYGGKAFLGSGGVHPEVGLTDYYLDEIPMRRIIIDHADELYVMADSSKLGRVAPAKVCDLDRITGVITDDGLDAPTSEAFRAAGVSLLIAGVSPPPATGSAA